MILSYNRFRVLAKTKFSDLLFFQKSVFISFVNQHCCEMFSVYFSFAFLRQQNDKVKPKMINLAS